MDKKEFQIVLGATIRERRTRLGYSQETFAEAAGMHRNYVGAIERGQQNVSLQNLLSIAEALSMPISMLFTLAEAEIIAPQKK